MDRNEKKEIENLIIETLKSQDIASSFTKKRTVATPTDSYSIVNRRFVTLNGAVADRPRSSVATVGQPYFNTTTSTPMIFDGDNWRNGVGSVVAAGRN